MPGFVQIMEFETSRIDELEALSRAMQEERGDDLLASKATITEDRDRPGHFFIIVEFDSYEEAMKNSDDPATGKYAEQMNALLAAPPSFRNLDVRTVMNIGQ
jgi:quinol monooxygenase YgiN